MLLYKHFTVWCKSQSLHNYAMDLLELQFQIKDLRKPLAHEIVWNQTYNYLQQPPTDVNHASDLALEHANREVKQALFSFRGQFTQDHLVISKGSNFRDALYRETSYCGLKEQKPRMAPQKRIFAHHVHY